MVTKKPNDVCDWTRGRLPLLASPETLEELSDPARDRANRHLADCRQCRDHLRRLNDALQALHVVAAETPDPDADPHADAEANSLWPHLRQRIRQSQPAPTESPFPLFEIRLTATPTTSTAESEASPRQGSGDSRRWSIAAGVLLMVAAGAFAFVRQSDAPRAPRSSSAVAKTAPGPASAAKPTSSPRAQGAATDSARRNAVAASVSESKSKSKPQIVHREDSAIDDAEADAPIAHPVEPVRDSNSSAGLSR